MAKLVQQNKAFMLVMFF